MYSSKTDVSDARVMLQFCERCRAEMLEDRQQQERYDRLEDMPIVGQLRRISRWVSTQHARTVRRWMRALKWKSSRMLTQKPLARVLYPLLQIVLWQRVWIVGETKWYFAATAEDAARYGGTEIYARATVHVRRPLRARRTSFYVWYAGQGEHVSVQRR
jgi:hypothetical protein